MTITGAQVALIAAKAAGYMSLMGSVTPGEVGAGFTAAAALLFALSANTTECNTIALPVTTIGDAFSAVLDYLKNRGHSGAAQALAAIR